jgi:adenylate kinase
MGGVVVVLLFGPPGCGKGTQAVLVARQLGIPAVSTGDIFRAHIKGDTPLGRQVSAIMASGGLVGDDLVNQVVTGRLTEPDCGGGVLLDGYPRTVPQAEYLDQYLAGHGISSPLVLHLDVPASVLVRRLSSRRQCSKCSRIYNLLFQPPKQEGRCDDDGEPLTHRKDDTEEVITERLKAYEEQTGPLIGYYKPRAGYYWIDGNRPPEEISLEISRLVAEAFGRK